jgi:hypothetical protein
VPVAGVESSEPVLLETPVVPAAVSAAAVSAASSSEPPHAANRPTNTSPAAVARCRT